MIVTKGSCYSIGALWTSDLKKIDFKVDRVDCRDQ